MKSLKDFNYLLSLDRRYTKTESEIFRTKDRSAGLQALYETQLKKIRFGVKIYFGKKIPAVS